MVWAIFLVLLIFTTDSSAQWEEKACPYGSKYNGQFCEDYGGNRECPNGQYFDYIGNTCVPEYFKDINEIEQADTNNENCTQDIKTGKIVCLKGETGKITGQNRKSSPRKSDNSHCLSSYYNAQTQCDGSQMMQDPQVQILVHAIRSQRNAGNIKEACLNSQKVNSLSWNANTSFGLRCHNAIRNCLSMCRDKDDSGEYDICKGLEEKVKLAKNQAIENAKSYSQSQECAQIASGCGKNSYNDPNCPQYCQKPGRQDDPLCRPSSKSNSQNILAQLPNPTTGNQNVPNQQIDSINPNDNSVESNTDSGSYSNFNKKPKEHDSNQDDFIISDQDLDTSLVRKPLPSNPSTSLPLSKLDTTVNLKESVKDKSKSNTKLKASNAYTTGGSSGGHAPFKPRSFTDLPIEEEPSGFFGSIKSFFESDKEKINRNMNNYYSRLLTQARNNQLKDLHEIAQRQKLTKKQRLDQKSLLKLAKPLNNVSNPKNSPQRNIASEKPKAFSLKNIILITVNFILLSGIIYFFFLRKTQQNN